MKKSILLLCVLLAMAQACKKNKANNNNDNNSTLKHLLVRWDKKYIYTENVPENAHTLVATPDGGAAVFFSWYSDTASGTCLLKTKADGTTDFLKVYAPAEFGDMDASLVLTSDHCYLLCGGSSIPAFGKTDAAGNILWKKQMNYHQLSHLRSITEKLSGGFLALAESPSEIYLVDLNASGDTNRTLLLMDSLQIGMGSQVGYDHSGKIIVAYSGRINDEYRSLIKAFDLSFNEIWSLQLVQAGQNILLQSFYINSDNSLLAGGVKFSDAGGDWQGYIVSVSSAGSLNWSKTYPDIIEYVMDIEPAPAGGYFVVGDNDVMVTKINSAGDKLWRESLEPSNQLGPCGNTLKISGNDVLFFGSTYSIPSMNLNPVLIKFTEQ